MTGHEQQGFRIKGWHVFAGFALAFGIIISVNMVMAVSAVRTFPGLEVKNGYVASQTFDARRAAQEGLGWTIAARHSEGQLRLAITDASGAPVRVAKLDATVGRATHVKDDVAPDFRFDGQAYIAELPLGAGNWNVRMTAVAQDGTQFSQRIVLIKE